MCTVRYIKLSAATQSLGCHTPFLMGVKQGKEKCMCKEGYLPVNSVFPRARGSFMLHPYLLLPPPTERCSLTCRIKKPRGCRSGAERRMWNVPAHTYSPFGCRTQTHPFKLQGGGDKKQNNKKRKKITKKLDEPVILNTFGLPAWQGEQPYIMSWGLLLVLMWPWVSK